MLLADELRDRADKEGRNDVGNGKSAQDEAAVAVLVPGQTVDRQDASADWPSDESGEGNLASAAPSLQLAADGTISVGETTWRVDKAPLVGGTPMANASYASFKRVIDLFGAAVGLTLLSPLLLVVAVAVKVTSRGPALYVHRRVGRNGRTFRCLKFRTMVADADEQKSQLAHRNVHQDSRTFKIPDDPRVTRLGGWLRKTSIDELPQLMNVLLGDMSLVGPRPALPAEVELYSNRDRMRLAVTPGLTCIWQVSGRSKLAFPDQVELDIEYIRRRSLPLDARLILLTIPAVLSSDGAY